MEEKVVHQIPSIQKAIEEGKSLITAFLTNATCGEACWHAREEICRCSCGGVNHGCLKTKDGTRPIRSSKINGQFYKLKGVGEFKDLYNQAKEINKQFPYTIGNNPYKFYYNETDIGAPARIKPATRLQIEKWEELQAFKDYPRYKKIYLLWEKDLLTKK